MTERLYYQDPYLQVFSAAVLEQLEIEKHLAVVLDATAFYPEGGGQPHDTGTLNGVPVLDVQADRDGVVLHFIGRPLEGITVQGEIDWDRRFDHMQQHTGQHILSQAFVQCCAAETVGFHLGADAVTIDLNRAPLSAEDIASAERLANRIVFDDYQVSARFVSASELATLPLRKPPAVDGPIRIVEIAGFDWSPCGGTHVTSSGQVGPIKLVRTERRKDDTRVYFVCGWRALADYVQKHNIVQGLAAYLTTSDAEILLSVQRLETHIKELQKALDQARTELLEHQLPQWRSQAKHVNGAQVVRLCLDAYDMAEIKEIARRLTEQPATIALLATHRSHAQFVFARSPDVIADMGGLMRVACAAVGGRGGGSPQFAQGGAPEDALPDTALDVAIEQLGATEWRGH